MNRHFSFAAAVAIPTVSLACFAACSSSPASSGGTSATADAGKEPVVDASSPSEERDAGLDLLSGCTRDPGPVPPTFDAASTTDPLAGSFTMAQALAGFPESSGTLTAAIYTEFKGIKCTLDAAKAPMSVANFIGLARGTRPYKLKGTWRVGRFYDGLMWHRVIPDFVIQGGDPLGTGTGGPGYDLEEENQVDEPLGTLAMAAAARPSGSQFYIVVGTGPAANYNVFGKCDTEAAIAISNVERDSKDKPRTPVHMLRVDIARCP